MDKVVTITFMIKVMSLLYKLVMFYQPTFGAPFGLSNDNQTMRTATKKIYPLLDPVPLVSPLNLIDGIWIAGFSMEMIKPTYGH